LEIDPAFGGALDGVVIRQGVILWTWLHQARREVLQVRPRGAPSSPLTRLFATRSLDRTRSGYIASGSLEIADTVRLRVKPLEAIDADA
jgi:tRNA (Thr-GGU) A37 N-methylase